MAFCAVVVAAGKSARFGGIKKEYRLLQGRPVLSRSLELFLSRPDCLACAAVVPPGGEAEARAVLGLKFLAAYRSRLLIVPGGEERSFSVLAGIKALADRLGEAADDTVALVHDGARPWASPALVQAVLDASAARGACVPALPVSDTIKEIDAAGDVVAHPRRASLRAVQTPQGFLFRQLREAYGQSPAVLASATDDAELWSGLGYPVATVPGERENIKITFPEDLP